MGEGGGWEAWPQCHTDFRPGKCGGQVVVGFNTSSLETTGLHGHGLGPFLFLMNDGSGGPGVLGSVQCNTGKQTSERGKCRREVVVGFSTFTCTLLAYMDLDS